MNPPAPVTSICILKRHFVSKPKINQIRYNPVGLHLFQLFDPNCYSIGPNVFESISEGLGAALKNFNSN